MDFYHVTQWYINTGHVTHVMAFYHVTQLYIKIRYRLIPWLVIVTVTAIPCILVPSSLAMVTISNDVSVIVGRIIMLVSTMKSAK